MTVAEMIAQRTAKLTAIKDSSNVAVSAKGGTPAGDLSGLQDAIASIPTGAALPELTTPAEVGHVVAGKEYIDAAGTKKTGTLVVCDSIVDVEYFGIAGAGVSLDIESTADGSGKTMTLREPNLKPENIKSGISIFGIQGSLVGGGAKEPYIEETYDESGNLIGANLVGYTAVRPYAFYKCTNLTSVGLPSGLTSIKDHAFNSCTSLALTSLPSGLTSIEVGVFYGCTNLALTSLPSELTSIKASAFKGCTSLALTSFPSGLTRIGDYTFSGCTSLALTSLPNGLTIIGSFAFDSCTSLALTSLPNGLTSIGNSAFDSCTGLTTITFQGKPRSISSSAFNLCTNIKTINVPWASGEVANAPWGATNATINYNYTG